MAHISGTLDHVS